MTTETYEALYKSYVYKRTNKWNFDPQMFAIKLHLPDSIIAHSDNYCHDKPEFSNVAIEMAESKNDEYISNEIYW
nr:12978_t:CDS:2 [Entrophospora candida]